MLESLDRQPLSPAAENNCWLPRSRRSPGVARRMLADLLTQVDGGHRFLDVGLLVVSELTTNAVLHGTPRGRLMRLSLQVDAVRLRVEVHDARADRSPVLRAATGEDESGRGLLLAKSLCLHWGCCPRLDVGKIVWGECGPAVEGEAR
ncbi:anti-sigma regulatory factor (Ser/Thr protein kinase) [Kitasatospora sp. MAP12-15]|uniref:ATP-binding protein n=1 Tax=unclassified Kitasatospora TaxID=2633591 RepID=UPI002475BFEE|nr:ATP-binding protein [Kitasatospora sp. MAP12-44]MDH6109479.1 anti-sigma regulatory factor (Ser/Thr protein kinase) [Kitasatospora sp. MAP12-44]